VTIPSYEKLITLENPYGTRDGILKPNSLSRIFHRSPFEGYKIHEILEMPQKVFFSPLITSKLWVVYYMYVYEGT
jgi:hypothetical protein